MRPHAASPGPPEGSAALRPLPAPEGKGKAALKHRGVRGSAAAQRDRAGVSASSPTLRPFPTTASQSAFLPPRGYFTASSALLSSPGANADTCVLTQGRSRTPHLSLKPILTPKVKITIKKSNPQLTHLHPPENPSPLNTFIPTRSQEMHSAALHHPFLRANRSPRAPSSTVRPAPHAGRASPALPARRTQRAPEARHGTARRGAGGPHVPGSPRRGGCGNKAPRPPRHRAWLCAGYPAAARPAEPRPTGAAPPGAERGYPGAPLPASAAPRAPRGRPSAAPGPAQRRARAPSYLLRVRRAHGRRPGSRAIMPRSGAGPSAADRAGPGGAGRGGEAAGSRAPPPPPAAAAGPRLSPDAGGGAGGAGREVSADGGAPGAPPRRPRRGGRDGRAPPRGLSRGALPMTAAEASGTAASPPGAAVGGGSPRPAARCGGGDCGERAAPRLASP